jgi:hypothetical protein
MRRKSWPFISLLFLLLWLSACGTAVQPVAQGTTSKSPTVAATSTSSSASLSISGQVATATPGTSHGAKGSITPTPTSQATGSAPPASTDGGLVTVPPGGTLPTEAQCAARVQASSFEPRPENSQSNDSVPTAQQLATMQAAPWGPNFGMTTAADTLLRQITGDYTGTTDEILQWAACKWGVSPDLVRAEAVVESYWRQNTMGDNTTDQTFCPPGAWNGSSCYQSYGVLQIKYYYFQNAWPMARDDTAFNAEYVYGILRSCYDGLTTYLSNDTPLSGYPAYHAGDMWGCIGRWFSGAWYTQGAVDYINKVKAVLADKTWLQSGF